MTYLRCILPSVWLAGPACPLAVPVWLAFVPSPGRAPRAYVCRAPGAEAGTAGSSGQGMAAKGPRGLPRTCLGSGDGLMLRLLVGIHDLLTATKNSRMYFEDSCTPAAARHGEKAACFKGRRCCFGAPEFAIVSVAASNHSSRLTLPFFKILCKRIYADIASVRIWDAHLQKAS
jgi:hypothetical protein